MPSAGFEGQLEGGGPRSPAERFDEVLEEWSELLEEGEAETVMQLMGQQLGAGSRDLFAPLAELNEQVCSCRKPCMQMTGCGFVTRWRPSCML